MTDPQEFTVPRGMVVCTTYGQITGETHGCMLKLRSRSEQEFNIKDVEWETVSGMLVDKARNDSVRLMFQKQCHWLLFIDGDMTFETGALFQILRTAYGTHPFYDVVGAYCNLRGELALPTIDSGTGTWESWYPYSGVVEVMRTGGAFLLVKRHVFERLKEPWFRLRVPARPIDFMAEVDNYARIKCDGQNPLDGETWAKLLKSAQEDPSASPEHFVPVEVGEDSGFLDRVRLSGMRAAVDTNIVTGHVDKRVLTWQDHKKAIAEIEKVHRYAIGLVA